jgi:hypothetical protein
MPRLFIVMVTVVSTMFAAAEDGVTIPEIEGPRAAYHQALAKIRAERDQKAAQATRIYAGRLQDLYTQLTEEGETQAAAAVKTEIDRVAMGVEPTNEERRKMTGLLLATRVLYEKNRAPAYMAAAKSEEQAHAAWATGLAQLEQHLIKQRQFAKVLVVKAERARTDEAKAAASAAATAPVAADSAKVAELTAKLKDTRWHIDNSGHRDEKSWMELKADGTTIAGWHKRIGSWTVLPDGRVDAIFSSDPKKRALIELSADLQTGTYGARDPHPIQRIPK